MPPSHDQSASRHNSSSEAGSMTAPPTAPPTTANKPRRSTVGVFSKRKGVRYRQDGAVLTCRFCEILRRRDEPFFYEDAQVVVFRPLRPIVPSHVLIVPRAHIRNVTMLEASHEPLLRQMKLVAERVLLSMPQSSPSPGIDEASAAVVNSPCPSGSETPVALGDSKRSEESSHCTDDEDSCSPRQNSNNNNGISTNKPRALKLSFHVPPFNSIDHVHMHGFHDAPRRMGVFGRLKYKTESWWCRSYDDVLVRLTSGSEAPGCKLESRDDELAPCGPVVDQDATTSVY